MGSGTALNRSLYIGHLVDILDVNKALPKKHLSSVENLFAKIEGRLSLQPGEGVKMVAESTLSEQFNLSFSRSDQNALLSMNERQQLISFEILSAENPITLAELAARTFASKATIIRDINLLEDVLAKYRVFLLRKPNVGILAIGREDDIRHTIISLIVGRDFEAGLLDLALWGKRKPFDSHQQTFKSRVFENLFDWGIVDCWRYAGRICEELSSSIPESDHLVLALYCTIMIRRFKAGFIMNLPDSLISKHKFSREYIAIERAVNKCITTQGIYLSVAELTELTLEVSTLTLLPRDVRTTSSTSPADEYTDYADQLMTSVSKRISKNLINPEVRIRLAEHLSRSFVRIQNGLPISNPLFQQVKNAYPDLWEAATETITALYPTLGVTIPVEETTYIVMYLQMALQLSSERENQPKKRVVVVCPHAGVTAWMLLTRLQSELPELEVVDVIPMRKLSQVDANQIDAIITSAAIESRDHLVITVSPLVGKDDIDRIRNILNKKNS